LRGFLDRKAHLPARGLGGAASKPDYRPERKFRCARDDRSSVRSRRIERRARFRRGRRAACCGQASISSFRRRGLRRPETATLFDHEMLCQLLTPRCARAPGGSLGEPGRIAWRRAFGSTGELLACAKTSAAQGRDKEWLGAPRDLLPLHPGHACLSGGSRRIRRSCRKGDDHAGIPCWRGLCAVKFFAVQTGARSGLTLVVSCAGERLVI